ncbi:hypothetical protein, partial [Microbacterium azadirachtae]|uniref:hypothetical protein n=1 Tax=Microbacterium azadirachtae TaxID=582680 RepID=UPI001B80AFF2
MDAATPPVTSAPGGHGLPGLRFGASGPRSGGHGLPAPRFGGDPGAGRPWPPERGPEAPKRR